MQEIEFNLLEEPWIRVRMPDCTVAEVSLSNALLHAHEYTDLAGELPSQDAAVLRLLLAVLHAVFYRVDPEGNASPLENSDDALYRWEQLWSLGHLPEKPIQAYLAKWRERFWLFHPAATFSRLIKTDAAIPRHITDLTGIDRSLMEQEGLPLPTALAEFLEFIGSRPLVGYNISFDMSFLQAACRGCSIQPPTNRCIDLLTLARRKIFGISDYKLATLAAHFSISMPSHRALSDCQTLLQLYEKLNEKQAAPG